MGVRTGIIWLLITQGALEFAVAALIWRRLHCSAHCLFSRLLAAYFAASGAVTLARMLIASYTAEAASGRLSTVITTVCLQAVITVVLVVNLGAERISEQVRRRETRGGK